MKSSKAKEELKKSQQAIAQMSKLCYNNKDTTYLECVCITHKNQIYSSKSITVVPWKNKNNYLLFSLYHENVIWLFLTINLIKTYYSLWCSLTIKILDDNSGNTIPNTWGVNAPSHSWWADMHVCVCAGAL